MPSKNTVKFYRPNSYYHVYNRGVAKQPIFFDSADKAKFLSIFERHLDPKNKDTTNDGMVYRKYDKDIYLTCYCLMGNHFHLLFFQKEDREAITSLMRAVMTAYTMYFNKKYDRVGTLFQGVFKASLIDQLEYLEHITRYIHMNPRTYKTYNYSSLKYYLGSEPPVWLKNEELLALFENSSYMEFLEDYEDSKLMYEEIKHTLADS